MTDAVVLTVKTAQDGRICALTLSGDLDFTTAAGSWSTWPRSSMIAPSGLFWILQGWRP